LEKAEEAHKERASRFDSFTDVSNGESNFSVVEEEQKKEETPSEPQSKLHIEESKIDMNTLSGEMKKEFIHIYTRQSWSKSIIIRSQVSIQKR